MAIQLNVLNLKNDWREGVSFHLNKNEWGSMRGVEDPVCLMRMLIGVIPSDGVVVMERRNVAHEKPRRREIALVLKACAFNPKHTVRKILFKNISCYRSQSYQARHSLMKEFKINTLLKTKYSRLSKCDQLKVKFVQALTEDPKVLFIDDVFYELGSQARLELFGLLMPILKKQDITVGYFGVDVDQYLSMAHRVVNVSKTS